MARCSECGGRDEHELNCALSTFDAREHTPVRESRWVATFETGREIPFGLGPSVTEEFARKYAGRTLVATMNAYADGDVVSVRREE